uniref:Protein ST7 homolog n=1 Tax=Ciona savignyi TaxID=51511 RepID=H2ZNX4_CIOSA
SWGYLWGVWVLLVAFLIYFLRAPLKLTDNISAMSMFISSLTPKFYVALTGTSSLLSGIILIFEWWYFRKYGTSFIEQVSVNHLGPLLGGEETDTSATQTNENKQTCVAECKVWRNPLNLLRGSEYNRYHWVTGNEALTYYDMNLSAQDHQTFFTCETDHLRPADNVMQKAWRERNPQARIKAAHQALDIDSDCATGYILLAEEEAITILEAERLFRRALKCGESLYRKSQLLQNHSSMHEAEHRRDTNVLVYIKRRLAMCARKLGKTREAVKMMRDLMKEFPLLNVLNIHENLLEALLELQAYADAQALLFKYDDISLPKSATICYTAALLKARAVVCDKFSLEVATKRGLTTSELSAVEAIHRAVEFNPHVPKSIILPPEHILKRGDSEAIAYTFYHLPQWKNVEGALNLLHCTWEGSKWMDHFELIPYPLEKGHLFYPYPNCTENADRELLPNYHYVSVYPKKEWPFFIVFVGCLCSFTAMLAILTHQYPDIMILFARALSEFLGMLIAPITFVLEKLDSLMPTSIWHVLTRI